MNEEYLNLPIATVTRKKGNIEPIGISWDDVIDNIKKIAQGVKPKQIEILAVALINDKKVPKVRKVKVKPNNNKPIEKLPEKPDEIIEHRA